MHTNRDTLLQLLTTLLALAAPLYARADPAVSQARQAIQAVYDRQEDAGAHLDADGTCAGYAPDYVSIDLSGKRSNFAQERQSARKGFAITLFYTGKVIITEIAVSGRVATLRVSGHDVAVIINPQANKPPLHVVLDSSSEDTWRKSGRGWLLVRTRLLSQHGTIDGRTVPEHPLGDPTTSATPERGRPSPLRAVAPFLSVSTRHTCTRVAETANSRALSRLSVA